MPVLSVRCVVTQHDGHTARSRRDTWITGHDFRGLALAATAQLQLPPERCEYRLFSPDVGRAFVGVLLEVLHEGFSSLVGPMGGPAVPPSLVDDRTCSLEELIALAGFGADAEGRGIYPVTVLYAGFLGAGFLGHGFPGHGVLEHAVGPPAREPKESDAGYRIRCASAERLRLERGRHEGFHAIRYDVPAADWKAYDLEALLGLVHALLPASEPRWRESGTITQEAGGTQEPRVPEDAPSTLTRYALEVARGDFVAHLRLPAFPVPALVEWLSSRRCEINLCHPMVNIQPPSRDARSGPLAPLAQSDMRELSEAR